MGSWAGLAPQFRWRPSQQHLLDLCEHVTDERWHLCAPPGAGKTLIGLELARRLDRPTLVLSPTTAIRDQWAGSTAMFGAPDRFATTDPDDAAPLLSVTYQLLGNPGAATAELRAAARRLWVAELASEHGTGTAEERVATTESHEPQRARSELGRHVRRLRRSLATGDDVGVPVIDLLGERTHDLVDRLTDRGIGCVVLDECHHLLDWWALVVAALIERALPAVIGLTATLPDPDSSREAANYQRVLGDVDAELHLAALVAEGAVAPWRDAVHLTPLTPSEADFLDGWTERFADELDQLLAGDRFGEWAVRSLLGAALDDRDAPTGADWSAFWDRDPLLGAALARWWRIRGLALPASFDPPPEVDLDRLLDVHDRLLLLDAWMHRADTTADGDDRAAVGQVTRRHGVSLTTSGIRWGRSVADVVCARSDAKARAAADVVRTELDARGRSGRALVVVERDRAGTPPAEARTVLGEDAGTSTRMLAALCAEPGVLAAGVLAVTGSGAWCDAAHADAVTASMSMSSAAVDAGATVRATGCDVPGAVALAVDGAAWGPSRWLTAAEAALDDGAAQVLVATRGLVGEGWDHAPIDVIVDCSEVASPTATTQLRGRALRIHAGDPEKVASLWDVAVVHPGAPGDWHRVRRRHEHWWGPDRDGAIRTGPGKVHPRLDLAGQPTGTELGTINEHSRLAALDRDATREAWARVDPGGVASSTVAVRSQRARRRVRTRAPGWRWSALGGGLSLGSGLAVGLAALSTPALWPVAAAGAGAAVALGARAAGRRRDDVETAAVLGEAVVAGLAAAGVPGLGRATVSARPDPAGGVVVAVDGVDDDAAAVWSAALAEALGPLGTPRWMVATAEQAWRVPGTVGATRDAAERFAAAVRERVPGAELLRAGTPEATVAVLREADRRRPDIDRALRWAGRVG
jgi:superfamily II DNA or RNA helicase